MVEFTVLGPLGAMVDGRAVYLRAGKPRLLLAVLMAQAGRAVPTDALLDAVWGTRPPPSAQRNLLQYVHQLRGTLTAERIQRRAPGYAFVPLPGDRVDAADFARLARQAQVALERGDAAAANRLQAAALALWQGPAFAEFADCAALTVEVARLGRLHLAVLEQWGETELILGRHRELADAWAEVVGRHPHREQLRGQLMLALYRSGRQAEAQQVYRQGYHQLVDELGVEPGPQLRELFQRILADDVTLAHQPALPAGPEPAARMGPALLPPDVHGFTGRIGEMVWLDAVIATGEQPSTVVISAVSGTAGVGKTALAVHWAHRARDRFPDGQLYINLRGFDPTGTVMAPAEATRRFLDALAVPPERIPADPDAQTDLYRTLLADRRMLVVLDNARDPDQIRPLLPGAPGCLVLVTSRNRLAGLIATEGARTLPLDLLTVDEARELLTRRLGSARIEAEPGAVDQIIARCARLPLALAIVAANAAAAPHVPLTAIAGQLRHNHDRLDVLSTNDSLATDVRAVFSWSYQTLSKDCGRLFRLLGLHPGPDISAAAAASLAGDLMERVEPMLAELTTAHLLTETMPGRFTFHDLLRAYAYDRAGDEDPELQRRVALTRLFDFYLAATAVAMEVAHPYEGQRRLKVPPAVITTLDLADRNRADRWLDAELANLLAAADHAAQHGWPDHTWQLSSALDRHLRTRARYREAETLHQHALDLARRLDDHAAEMNALNSLGYVERRLGRYEQAVDHYQRALRIAQDIADRHGERNALAGLGQVHWSLSHHEQAIDHYQRALRIAQDIADRVGERNALAGLGDAHRMLGRYEQAGGYYGQALRIAQDIGDRVGELNALAGLGDIHVILCRYEQAGGYFGQALRIAQDISDRRGELNGLAGLGRVDLWLGRYEQAGGHFGQALQIAQDISERSLELHALICLGTVHRMQGRYAEAAHSCQQVLALARELGNSNWQYEAVQGLGRLHHATGHPDQALTHHQQALQYATDLAQAPDQARAHDGLALAHQALNNHDQARRHWQHALDILTTIGTDHTDDIEASIPNIRAHLANLDQQQPPIALEPHPPSEQRKATRT